MTRASDRPSDDVAVQTLDVERDGATRRLAVRVRPGRGTPIVWMGGFRSDMRATKALALDHWASEQGRPLIRFDYTGHGASDGDFANAVLTDWIDDARAILDRYVAAPPVIVGSSMGGWIACLIARAATRARTTVPKALVLIAPALDFTEHLMWQAFPQEIRERLLREGVWYRQTPYSNEPVPISLRFIEDGRKHCLLDGPFDPGCPVHILQGMDDPDVPYAHALKIVDRLPKADTVLTMIADGDHRLSRPQDIALLLRTVEEAVGPLRSHEA